jgi:hypothetical protein
MHPVTFVSPSRHLVPVTGTTSVADDALQLLSVYRTNPSLQVEHSVFEVHSLQLSGQASQVLAALSTNAAEQTRQPLASQLAHPVPQVSQAVAAVFNLNPTLH